MCTMDVYHTVRHTHREAYREVYREIYPYPGHIGRYIYTLRYERYTTSGIASLGYERYTTRV